MQSQPLKVARCTLNNLDNISVSKRDLSKLPNQIPRISPKINNLPVHSMSQSISTDLLVN